MGTEIAVPVFGPLIGIGLVILLFVAIRRRRSTVNKTRTLGLGRSRIALGYLGAIAGLVVYSCIDTVDISRIKVARATLLQLRPHIFSSVGF